MPSALVLGVGVLAIIAIASAAIFVIAPALNGVSITSLNSSGRSFPAPDGEVPDFTILSEDGFTRQGFAGKNFEVETEATSGRDMHLIAEQLRHENPELGLMNVDYFPLSGNRDDTAGSAFVTNSRTALDARYSSGPLKDMPKEEKDAEWEKYNGVEVFSFADTQEKLDKQRKESMEERPTLDPPDAVDVPQMKPPKIKKPRIPKAPMLDT